LLLRTALTATARVVAARATLVVATDLAAGAAAAVGREPAEGIATRLAEPACAVAADAAVAALFAAQWSHAADLIARWRRLASLTRLTTVVSACVMTGATYLRLEAGPGIVSEACPIAASIGAESLAVRTTDAVHDIRAELPGAAGPIDATAGLIWLTAIERDVAVAVTLLASGWVRAARTAVRIFVKTIEGAFDTDGPVVTASRSNSLSFTAELTGIAADVAGALHCATGAAYVEAAILTGVIGPCAC